MASQVILKKSSVAARVPVAGDLAFGELALNYTDGVLYYKKSDNTISSISGSGGGSTLPAAEIGATTSSVNKLVSIVTTAGDNTYTITYTIGYVDVFVNGVKLNPADFTATNGTTVIVTGLLVGDEVQVIGTTQVAVSATATYKRTRTVSTAEQTIFDSTYTAGYVEVFYNGILLDPNDYTATNGTSITLATPATLGDIVETIAYSVAAVNPTSILTAEWGGTGLSSVGSIGNVLTSTGTAWVSSPLVVPSGSLTFTGDATGTGTTGSSTVLTLANTEVTPGAYTTANITVDAKGRITAASSGVAASVSSEKINKTIDNQVAYIVTGTLGTAVTMPATVGYKYIVHSIYITNVDVAFGATTSISGNIAFSGGTTVVLANKVPVPARGSLELLKKPQVLNPSDAISLQSLVAAVGTSSVLQAIITYETVDIGYFGIGKDAPDSVTDMYVANGTAAIVDSIRLVNNSDLGNIAITLSWTDATGVLQAYLTSNFIIPSNGTVEICESSKRIPAGHKIRAAATTANAVSVFISGRTQ